MEKLTQIICRKVGNYDPTFFRVIICYFLGKAASNMRVMIKTIDRGIIPINIFAINLNDSGTGKSYSTNIMEDNLLAEYTSEFLTKTYPTIAEEKMAELATKRAYIAGEDPDLVIKAVENEFSTQGKFLFQFNKGTEQGVKQQRHKLLMAQIGALNWEMDEMADKIQGCGDLITAYLELYDIGKTKNNLIKNTKDTTRVEEISGMTPANMNWFGTPNKLLNGDKLEEEFWTLMETGFARRCLFGFGKKVNRRLNRNAADVLDARINQTDTTAMDQIRTRFGQLAHITNYGKLLQINRDVTLELIEYQMHCMKLADDMGQYETLARTEMTHRYFKALKLAGAYAFYDGHDEITVDNLYHAICMIEESGRSFKEIQHKDKPYAKLAKYIAEVKHDVNRVDLAEDLPFFRGSVAQKNEMLNMAIAWGYKNHIVIKKSMSNNIEFLTGETLEPTDLNNLRLACSKDIALGYQNIKAPFDKLHKLMLQPDYHWINHHTVNGHRSEDTMIPGFDMVVLDVDDGSVKLENVKALLGVYTYLLYTTKRHDPAGIHRFRLIFPLNYQMSMGADEFKEFMKNLFDWLPFEVDNQTGQRARKWLTNAGYHEYHQGELLDARLFIPNTDKSNKYRKVIQDFQSLTNLERWFIVNTQTDVNRNTQLFKYAMVLMDMGNAVDQIREKVCELNQKLKDKIPEAEIDSTIMSTVAKKIIKQQAAKATA